MAVCLECGKWVYDEGKYGLHKDCENSKVLEWDGRRRIPTLDEIERKQTNPFELDPLKVFKKDA